MLSIPGSQRVKSTASPYFDHFAIIPSRLASNVCTSFPGIKLLCRVWMFAEEKNNFFRQVLISY